jgi:hypothetical protein
MSSRVSIQQIVSTSAPVGAALGDEWLNPTTGILSKRTLVNGVVDWVAVFTANAAAGAAGSIPIQVSPGVTAFVPLGTSGYVLTAGNNTATWQAVSGLNSSSVVTSIIAGTDTSVSTSTGAVTIWNTGTLQSITNRGASTTNQLNLNNGITLGSTANSPIVMNGNYTGNIPTFISAVGTLVGTTTTVNIYAFNYQHGLAPVSTATISSYYGQLFLPTLNNTATYGSMYGAFARIDMGAAATSGTVATWIGFTSENPGRNAAADVRFTNHYGFRAQDPSAITATNVYGYNSTIALVSGVNKWNIYASGTAPNYFSGSVGVGTTAFTYGEKLAVSGGQTVSGIFTSTNTTNATSTNSGALQVVGGVGIGGDVYTGGILNVSSTASIGTGNANYVKISGTGTGFGSIIQSAGTDANVDLYIRSQNTSNVYIGTTNGIVAQFQDSGTSVSWLQINAGNGSTSNIALRPGGGGTNIGMTYVAKGAASHNFATGNTQANIAFQVSPGVGTITNYIQVLGAQTGTAVALNTLGAESSVNLNITTKGNASTIISSTSATNSTATGALQVVGGVGVGGGGYFGGTVTATNFILNGYQVSTGTSSVSSSGTGTTTTFVISNITQSTSTNSGALQVWGGAGIGGNLYVGGTVTGGGVRSTSSPSAPTSPTPVVGDIWYNTLTDDVYRFTSDGTSTYWLDMSGPTVSGTSRLNIGQYIPSVYTTSSIATAIINVSVYDQYNITALSTATTFSTTSTTTPNDGQKLMIRVLDNGTAQTLNWGTTFTIVGTTLPTTTVATKTTYVGCVYNSFNNRWDVIAVTTQA